SSSVVVYRSLVFFLMLPPPPRSTLFPYTTLFRSISQAAAAHRLAMRFLAKADDQLNQVHGYNPNAWSAHSVEAARLAHAAGKLMGAFGDTVLTVQRRRNGGKQVVQVVHQQVAVGAGGKAIVAGAVRGRGKTGAKRRGPK